MEIIECENDQHVFRLAEKQLQQWAEERKHKSIYVYWVKHIPNMYHKPIAKYAAVFISEKMLVAVVDDEPRRIEIYVEGNTQYAHSVVAFAQLLAKEYGADFWLFFK